MVASPADWTIDRLAAHAGMTVRNVRAHAARGLLPPPRMQGRTGFYGSEHLARLDLITHLQAEGFSLAAIERLVESAPNQSAERALSQYLEMLTPWRAEPPVEMTREEFTSWLGEEPASFTALVGAGMVEEIDGDRIRVHSPEMVRAGVEAAALGLPVEALLRTRETVLAHLDEVASDFVDLFRRTVWQEFVDAGLPTERLEDVRHAVAALQPIAARTVMSAFRETMPRAVGELVREASKVIEDGGGDPM
ncbi:MerR family transcriptional regulator [Actinomycetospora chiangmaiensis]|uniref:MerR family transcriptional regulator n=1 Tax=Actinomycetospora chiangmaiensis TaxID=402650 RepID=UPI0003A4FAEC|nr:MerR family transcriptional regulator [Actinomycetospora chiangmaiensis]